MVYPEVDTPRESLALVQKDLICMTLLTSLLTLNRVMLASTYAKLSGFQQLLHIYCTNAKVASSFSFKFQQKIKKDKVKNCKRKASIS